MNLKRILIVAFLHALVTAISLAQIAGAQTLYVPPSIATYGEQEHYRYLAVIETDCQSFPELYALVKEMQNAGALVSVMTSPRRLLAWVPPNAQGAVLNARSVSARGTQGVRFCAYDAQEVNQRAALLKGEYEYNEADETIVKFLDFVRRPKTEAELARIKAREEEIRSMNGEYPRYQDHMFVNSDVPKGEKSGGGMLFGGPDPTVDYASKSYGNVVHTSFFVESRSGTGSWNWVDSVYDDYKLFYIAGINFWTSLASNYGRTLTATWRLFGRSHTYSQVTGEPTAVGDNVYIPEVIQHITSSTPGNSHWSSLACRYAHMYNGQIESAYGVEFAFCAFISYKPTTPKAIHPTAWSVNYSNGDVEGIYFSSDTQYWQAGLNPFAAPMRNCFAHEMGHLFGAPDEYYSTIESCNYTYRGMKNVNCQRTQAAYNKPGWNMTGLDGIMVTNYLEGTSIATPVHTGLISAASASPVRCFKTDPANISYEIISCDNSSETFTTSMCFPLEVDYCMKAKALAEKTISGVHWYFDYWEIKHQTGSPEIHREYANSLPSYALWAARSNPITEVIAHYTSDPPDFNVANTTLIARLGEAGTGVSPAPAVALRWRVKYDMTLVQTKIEYERTAGNWVELKYSNMFLSGPGNRAINQYTGVMIYSVPLASGSDEAIQSNRTYNFRIVGYFNTVRGAVSNTASVTTRPSTPADTIYCHDANEPNSVSSPKLLTSSGPGMLAYTVKAAATISGMTGEFSWARPKADYYRITAINLSSASYGEHLRLTLRIKSGSNFEPLFRAQRAGSTTYINSINGSGGSKYLKFNSDGEYIVSVEPQMYSIGGSMYDIADRYDGYFGFGEYEIQIERGNNYTVLAPLCMTCARLLVQRPLPGWLRFDPEPPPELLLPRKFGFDITKGLSLGVEHIPAPGYENDGFEGDYFFGKSNPLPINIGANTPPGDHTVYPISKPIDPKMAELVLIHPDGPGGPFVRRTLHAIGTVASAQATAPDGYVFVGWGYDTSAITNPLPVTMWRSKVLVAYFRPRPCIPTQMTKWEHSILVRNVRQAEVSAVYGMDPSASDGLEPGQTDLPPLPPLGTYDVRFINIAGSQGSTTDLRAVQQEFSYQLRVQTGSGTTPVRLTWDPPPAVPDATFSMSITGVAVPIDMRTTSEYQFDMEGTYIVKITVKAKSCPPPTKPKEVEVVTGTIDPSNFPCVDIELIVKNANTKELLPFYDPFLLKIYEKNGQGEDIPAKLERLFQMDSTIWIRLCSNDESEKPEREIIIIPDDEDPDRIKDTIDVNIHTPRPPGQGNLVRLPWQYGKGWDLISMPLDVEASYATGLFSSSPATYIYGFNPWTGAYYAEDTMKFGVGYWLSTGGTSVVYYGIEKNILAHAGLNGNTQPYGWGWNLIGAPSKSLPVAMITQNPPAGLMAIFGWDMVSGYIVPTAINPGRGYWVRVKTGTTLTMEGTSVQGGLYFETAYEKALRELQPAAWIEVESLAGEKRYIEISTSELNDVQEAVLALPPVPSGDAFDVRFDNETVIAQPGDNPMTIRGASQAVFTLLHRSSGMSYLLVTESGEILADLSIAEGNQYTWRQAAGRNLFLKVLRTGAVPDVFSIGKVYPNPASSGDGITIPFFTESGVPVSLSVSDLLGRTVRTLLFHSAQTGAQIIQWDGRDDAGNLVPAGAYYIRLAGGERNVSTTITIIR